MSSASFNFAVGNYMNKGDSTWSANRASVSGNVGNDGDLIASQVLAHSGFYLQRGYLFFDTSSLPDNATVSAVQLAIYGRLKVSEYGQGLYILGVTTNNNSSLVGGDFNITNFSGAVQSTLLTDAVINGGGLNTINLAPAYVNLTGYTKYGFVGYWDWVNTQPSPDRTNGDIYYFYKTSHTPVLTVVYTTPPVVTTGSVSSIGVNGATLAGNVTDAGGGTVVERGFVYGLSANPTTAGSKKMVAGTTGAYTGDIASLAGSTLYHYRSYVITENSTQYGADATFTTLPACETSAMTNLSVGSATANGNVTSVGEAITERGFVWDVATAPTVSDNKVVVAGTTGAMASFITAMPIGRRVYLRSFATNETGTVYGNEINFIMVGGVAVFNCL